MYKIIQVPLQSFKFSVNFKWYSYEMACLDSLLCDQNESSIYCKQPVHPYIFPQNQFNIWHVCLYLTLKWSRGIPMDPKISFRAWVQKHRISWRCLFLTCLPPRIFWHVFEKYCVARCTAIALGSLWTPLPVDHQQHSAMIFHMHKTFDLCRIWYGTHPKVFSVLRKNKQRITNLSLGRHEWLQWKKAKTNRRLQNIYACTSPPMYLWCWNKQAYAGHMLALWMLGTLWVCG